MKHTLIILMVGCAVWATSNLVHAQVTVGVDMGEEWLGYMNVSELPENGGAFVFGSPWGTVDLVAEFSSTTLTLSPNTIGDPNEFWYQNTCNCASDPLNPGGPGQAGNKIMEANMYVEKTDTLAGQTVTFEGNVLSNSLSDLFGDYLTKVFIKDFAPDYSTFNVSEEIIDVGDTGAFSISLFTDPGLGRHVQYGFATTGPNVWVTDAPALGTVVVEAFGTPPGTAGDFDDDGDVDGNDFLVWQRDTAVGSLTDWQDNYGFTPPPVSAVVGVPEPSSCVLALLVAVGATSLRRQHRGYC